MQRKFTMVFFEPGTSGGDWDVNVTMPSACQLVHVSAVSSNTAGAQFTIGDDSDADEHLTAQTTGVSGTPTEFDGDDFVDSDGNSHTRYYPHIADGEILTITVDHDYNGGGSGADSANLCIVLTFVEG